jgi:beta-phosphoglucomutase-like phosphatase (HAD superfamily)
VKVADQPKAAVFDLDDTLILSEHRNRAVWEAFLTGRGLTVDDAFARRLTGRRGKDVLAELFPGQAPEALIAEILDVAATADLPPISAAPGAGAYVRSLAGAKVPLGLVTSAHQPYVDQALDDLGVDGAFDVLVTSADVTRGKPDPEGYLRACQALGVAPADAVGFEDSEAGVAAVRAAGMRCVAVSTTLAPEALVAADLVVPSFEGLPWPPPFDPD